MRRVSQMLNRFHALNRHARACRGHPRLAFRFVERRGWPGRSPAMTEPRRSCQKPEFAKPFKLIWVVQSPAQKYFASRRGRNSFIASHIPHPIRGPYRGRHDTLGAGGDGRFCTGDERCEADGEAVWSRRPDAGVKLATMPGIAPVMVTTKPGSPGRARRKPLKPIAQGVPDSKPVNLW